jgi:Tat protein secretion system quality control protein TatD with DNase activity
MVSSKLKSTYGKGVKNYNLHPFEVNAVTSASLQNLTNTAKSWMKYLPKEQLIGYLDDIIRYTKGEKLFDTNSLKMIGQDGLDQLILYYKNDKKVYRDLLTKLAKQANYLKSQVNIAM